MNVYLSGAIEGESDLGNGWRRDLTSWIENELGHSVLNPVEMTQILLDRENAHDFRDWKSNDLVRFRKFMRQIIKQDIDAVVKDTDYLICNWTDAVRSGGGTQGEITVAYLEKIPIYLVYSDPIRNLSSWIAGCTTVIFKDFESLKTFLIKNYRRENEGT